MTIMIKEQTWNNIPLIVKDLIVMMSEAMVAQDIHSWERKCLNNERFHRM